MSSNNLALPRRGGGIFRMTLLFLVTATMPVRADTSADLVAALRRADLGVKKLTVRSVEGIMILRGQTTVKSDIVKASRVARDLGHTRVANMIELIPVLDDNAIERETERQLSRSRALDGCHFTIDSVDGVLTLGGTVQRELQKDAAQNLVTRVPGVRSVIFTVTLRRR